MNAMVHPETIAAPYLVPTHIQAMQHVSGARLSEMVIAMAADAWRIELVKPRLEDILLKNYCRTKHERTVLRHFINEAFSGRIEFLRDLPGSWEIHMELESYMIRNKSRVCLSKGCANITWGNLRYCKPCRNHMDKIHNGVV